MTDLKPYLTAIIFAAALFFTVLTYVNIKKEIKATEAYTFEENTGDAITCFLWGAFYFLTHN